MCDVVDISDDEDSSLLKNDVGVVLKDESANHDLPQQQMCSNPGVGNVASSSGNLRSSFIGMGFAPSLVNKVIEENGEQNAESLLEILFTYSQPKSEFPDDCLLRGGNGDLAANRHASEAFHNSESSDSLDSLFGKDTATNAYCEADSHMKMEPNIGSGVGEEKMASLLKMKFSLDEVRFAMERLGKHASFDQLVDFIFAARMAKKYEKDANNSFPGDEDCNNEALFGIMEKTLRLLEMGFTENAISAVFERCGSEAPLPELLESIVTGGTVSNHHHKYSSSLSKQSAQINCRPLKRKMGDFLMNQQPLSSVLIKTEECSSDVVPQIGTSDFLEKLKGKMPKQERTDDERNDWLKPKEEFMEESSNSEGRMWLEARRGTSNSTNDRIAASRRRVLGILEDRNPTMSMPNPCKSLTSVVSKPPYFLYGNATILSHDSWAKISKFLYSSQPEFANTQLYSALSRKEGYLHNLPNEDRFHIHPKGPMTIEEAIPHSRKWWPSWDDRKQLCYISYETSGVSLLCDKLGRILADCRGVPSTDQQRQILQQCREKNLVWVGKCKLGRLEPEHLEHIMGYPFQHTQVVGLGLHERLRSLKHSLQTDTLGYHLSVLNRLVPGGVTVLSFFSGIGGAEIALHRLGIRLKSVVSVEPCEIKRRIMRKWWENSGQSGELIQMESINKLSSQKLGDLMKKFKGFDLVVCQNPYSVVDSDSLSGLDFSMFVEFVRVLQSVRSTMATYS